MTDSSTPDRANGAPTETAAEITANDAHQLLANCASDDEQSPPTGGLVLDA